MRDSRECAEEPLTALALHLPMSKLLTNAASLDLAGRYLLICATGKRSCRGRRAAALAGVHRLPVAARRNQESQSFRVKRAWPLILWSLLVWPGSPTAAAESSASPLLDLARERQLGRKSDMRVTPGAPALRQAEHALEQAHAPPDDECASKIGATRFADLHADVGTARVGQGDFSGAAAAYRSAHACRPRDAQILAALAGVLFDARDYAGAREVINRSLAIEPRAVNSNRLAGNIDFVEERWADAVARFRYVSASDPDRIQAGYGQLMLWLAQMRAGVAKPEYVARTPGEGWPQPLLLYCAANTPRRSSSPPSRKGTMTSTHNRTPAPTSGCAKRCSTWAKRIGRVVSPRWRATTSPRS